MGLRVYLPLAVVTFLAATTGADLFARTSIAGESFGMALRGHLYWAAVQFIGTLLLLAPFLGVAFICARVERQVHWRSVAVIFAAAMLALLYFYFQGHQAAQHAMLEKRWTAAALSIGLLPFFIGVPVLLGVLGAGALAARFDHRAID